MELKGKKINFLGDSITEGCGTSDISKGFVALIGREEGLASARNYGIGGTRIARQTYPSENPVWDQDFSSRIAAMDPDADVVVVFGGTNDYGHGNAPFGCEDDRTPDTYCGALHFLMTGLIEKYPTSEIVFLTPIHRVNEDAPSLNGRPLKDYVDVMRRTAEKYSLPVLDLYSFGGIYPNIESQKDALCPDGLHPNDAGNRRIAQRIVSFLKTL